jgi:outer membrane cobalamin receptor
VRPLLLPRPRPDAKRRPRVDGASLFYCSLHWTHAFIGGLLLATAAPALAQYPGEITGRVSDAVTGAPVENAFIEVVGTGLTAYSDGHGEFRIRGLESGSHTLRIDRMGYATLEREVDVRNGASTWVNLSLGLRPVEVEEIQVEATAVIDATRDLITRAEIEDSGELNAAGLLQGRLGIVVQRRGPGAPQTVSIRGSSADEVLVLLDGAPLNDPITGNADLSTVPTSQIETVTVLRGSHSATYGPGAAGGVVLIESRSSAPPLGLGVETGSLGFWSGSAETSGSALGLDWSAGGQARRADGSFEFERLDALGGGRATRQNVDISETAAFVSATGDLAGGGLRLRAGYTGLDRGIPGPSFLPTSTAREELRRWRGQATWDRVTGRVRYAAHVYGVLQDARFVDANPPQGLPYDSRTDALALGGRLSSELELDGLMRSLWGGLELRDQRYESTAVDAAAPGGRTDVGLFAGGQLAPGNSSSTRLVAALRVDRDDLAKKWYPTHELSLTTVAGPATLRARHASSYSPPTFGDQFFREGVAVEPNPDLHAERIPADFGLGVSIAGNVAGTAAALSVDGYIADVKDMIVWAPDFRFVWSPRNFDVKRRGIDVQAELGLPAHDVELHAAYSLARVTYDREDDDNIQVIYRPRHSGSIGASWRPGRWSLGVDARFVGTRYPVPAPLNALEPYWTWDIRLREVAARPR